MNKQVTVALIGAIAVISAAAIFTPVGAAINHYLSPEAAPVLTSFISDKRSPQFVETQINWTAIAKDTTKEILYYSFYLKSPSTNDTWECVQDWSTQNWWDWRPTKPGNYIIKVKVSSGKTNEIFDSRSMNYIIFQASTSWADTGDDLYRIGRYNEAIEAFDKAIEINPKDSDAWNGKGSVLFKLNKFDEAIKAYDKAIEINPQNLMAWNNKGNTLNRLNKYDEAIKAFDNAIKIDPPRSEAWNNKGYALSRLREILMKP